MTVRREQMTMTADKKNELIGSFRAHDGDTGSAEVQIALLTERIKGLTEHFKIHKKDHASRRGLLALVGRRATMLRYLKQKNPAKHRELVATLGIRAH